MILFESEYYESAKAKFEELKTTGNHQWLYLIYYFERYCGWENSIIEKDNYLIYEEYDDRYEQCELVEFYDGRAIMRDKRIDDICRD